MLLSSFGFLREECTAGEGKRVSFKDAASSSSPSSPPPPPPPLLGRLNGTRSSIACNAHGNGFSLSPAINNGSLVSTATVAGLAKELSGEAYSISLWLLQSSAFVAASGIPRSLMSVESSSASTSTPSRSCLFNLRLVTNGTYISVELCETPTPGATYSPPDAPGINVDLLHSTKIQHLVLTFDMIGAADGSRFPRLSLYQNAKQVLSVTLTSGVYANRFRPSHWNSLFYIKLAPPYTASTPLWPGSIYAFSIYNAALSLDQVASLYSQGLPLSSPVVVSQTFSIQENGEVGDHSQSPTFYNAAIPATQLVALALPAYEQDDEPSSPNFRADKRMRVWITRLPTESTGALFYLNGSALRPSSGSVLVPFDDASGSYSVRLRPALNAYSKTPSQVMTSFAFRAQDGRTLHYSPTALVNITIAHIDKPPIATTGLGSTVSAAAAYARLAALSGRIDPDSSHAISQAYITALPKKGSLFAVYSNGTVNRRAALTLTGAGDALIPFGSFQLAYTFTGRRNSSTDALGRIGIDAIWFAVADTAGRKSVPTCLNITIVSPLVAIPAISSLALPLQGVAFAVPVSGRDSSSTQAQAAYMQVISLPSHGALYWSSKAAAQPILAGGISSCTIRLPGSSPAPAPTPFPTAATSAAGPSRTPTASPTSATCQLYFKSDASFFSFPNRTAAVICQGTASLPIESSSAIAGAVQDAFTFRLIAAGTGVASAEATQTLRVQDVNKPTEVSFSHPSGGSITIYAVSRVDSSASQSLQAFATISGFSLVDPDMGVDLVRARVFSSNRASLTLNQDYIPCLDFVSQSMCRGSGKAWQCKGSGFANSDMSFVGRPDAIQAALNGLRYESITPNIVDNVTVVIYDGVGDQCLSKTAVSAASHTGCFQRSTSFSVSVLGYASFPASQLYSTPEATILRVEFVGGLAGLCCCLCVCAFVRRKIARLCGCAKAAAGNKDDVLGEDEGEEDNLVEPDSASHIAEMHPDSAGRGFDIDVDTGISHDEDFGSLSSELDDNPSRDDKFTTFNKSKRGTLQQAEALADRRLCVSERNTKNYKDEGSGEQSLSKNYNDACIYERKLRRAVSCRPLAVKAILIDKDLETPSASVVVCKGSFPSQRV